MADVIERGDVYFFYRPDVEEQSPEGMEDVQRFYMILSPREKDRHRLIVIGRKKLPEVEDGGDRYWGFVDKVGSKPEDVEEELSRVRYETKTRGERHQPGARPAGEGVYAIVRHDDHTHLAYILELPEKPGEVQRALNIDDRASYILSIKNPEAASPRRAGLDEEREAEFPKRLQERFDGRRFIEADPPDFLDYEGAELLLIGADERPQKELGIRLKAEDESRHSADVFTDLHLERSKHPTRPLFKGKWA